MEFPKGTSPAVFRGVVAGASAAYQLKKGVPTVEEISKYCAHSPKTIGRVLATPEFKQLMKLRGYPFEEVAKLSPEQYFAVQIMTDPSNKKPLAAKLRQAGITMAQYRGWMKQPLFREYITKISEDMLGEHVADVHTMVLNKAVSGDLTAAKLVYELNGRHDPNKQQVVDLQNIIGLLLEIITRYVTDPKVLVNINKDIDLVLSGGQPDALHQFDVKQIANNVQHDVVTTDLVQGQVVTAAVPDKFFDFEDVK